MAKKSFNRLLITIQLIRRRVDFLNNSLSEKELADASQLLSLLEKTKDRFKTHVQTIYHLKTAYETNHDKTARDKIEIEYKIEKENKDHIYLIEKANDCFASKVEQSEEGAVKCSDKVDPKLDAELENFIKEKKRFIEDYIGGEPLGEYYSELLAFLIKTRTQMDSIILQFSSEAKQHLQPNNENQFVGFKQLSNECYHRLEAANRWIRERLVVLEVLKEIAQNKNYKQDIRELKSLSETIGSAIKSIEEYLKNVYDILAEHKSEGSLTEKQDLIESAMRKNGFISLTHKAIETLDKLANPSS